MRRLENEVSLYIVSVRWSSGSDSGWLWKLLFDSTLFWLGKISGLLVIVFSSCLSVLVM